MSCPFFIPGERFDGAGFVHPSRLPLGAAYRGGCGAPGHDGTMPSDVELEQCNLGYARGCSRFPQEREADAIRFSVMREKDGQIVLCYVSELNYLPRDSGSLKYESLTKRWLHMHPNQRVQGMAECFLQSYLEKRRRNERERNDD